MNCIVNYSNNMSKRREYNGLVGCKTLTSNEYLKLLVEFKQDKKPDYIITNTEKELIKYYFRDYKFLDILEAKLPEQSADYFFDSHLSGAGYIFIVKEEKIKKSFFSRLFKKSRFDQDYKWKITITRLKNDTFIVNIHSNTEAQTFHACSDINHVIEIFSYLTNKTTIQ